MLPLGQIIDFVMEGLHTDGGHHKQWYLEQVLVKLGVDIDKLAEIEDWDRGIAP